MEPFPDLLRAARLTLGLTQDELAEAAGISTRSLMRFELGREDMHIRTHKAIKQALEARGVVFLKEEGGLGPGFRIPPNHPRVLRRSRSKRAP
jgi:transcriptional regulator with XRE-family HTH domain